MPSPWQIMRKCRHVEVPEHTTRHCEISITSLKHPQVRTSPKQNSTQGEKRNNQTTSQEEKSTAPHVFIIHRPMPTARICGLFKKSYKSFTFPDVTRDNAHVIFPPERNPTESDRSKYRVLHHEDETRTTLT